MEKAPDGLEWQLLEEAHCYKSEQWKSLVENGHRQIELHRKRDLLLRLQDRKGQPLTHQPVEIRQLDTDFAWGFCGWGIQTAFRSGEAKTDRMRRLMSNFARLFNAVNVQHYWCEKVCSDAPSTEEFQGFPDFEITQAGVDWALSQGLRPKGHPLFWPVPKAIPSWLAQYDQDTRLKFLEIRIRTLVQRFKGRIRVYDAVNESIWEPSFARTHERHWPHLTPLDELVTDIKNVLHWAREEDPDACYLVNDYGVLVGDTEPIPIAANDGSFVTRDGQARRYYSLILALIEAGAAPDAVGLQAFHGGWGFHDRHLATLDLLGTATGLPVHITEFQSGGKQAQTLAAAGAPRKEIEDRIAEYVDNALVCIFGHPSVESFYFWYDQDYLFDANGRPSSWYKKLEQRIQRDWRTHFIATTDREGCVRMRGFTGTYRISRREENRQPTGVLFHLPQATREETMLTLALP